jgi:hypothetical protein
MLNVLELALELLGCAAREDGVCHGSAEIVHRIALVLVTEEVVIVVDGGAMVGVGGRWRVVVGASR